MRNFFLALLLLAGGAAAAQTELSQYQPGANAEGTVYFLPKTALRIVVMVEKTTYTPGDFCLYASRYLRLNNVKTEPSVDYRVAKLLCTTYGVADKEKAFAVKFNAKSAASNITLADDGVLLAINATAEKPDKPAPFKPAKRPAKPDARQFMSEEILAAGSTAKMAELTAREIYDIRGSKNELNRGEADYMPRDGEQLRIMLDNLDTQDNALTSLFAGTTVKDTIEYTVTLCPDGEIKRQTLFRLSRKRGLVEADDLSGRPFYISVADAKALPQPAPEAEAKKKKKKEDGIYVNVPGKMSVTIYDGAEETASFSLPAAQFGATELLSGDLFNKRYTTHLTLNPATGAVSKLEAEQPE